MNLTMLSLIVFSFFNPPSRLTVFASRYATSDGVDPNRSGYCLMSAYLSASGSLYPGQNYSGYISGHTGYNALPLGTVTNTADPCVSEQYDGLAVSSGSIESGRSYTYRYGTIQTPVQTIESNKDTTHRFYCHPDSGGGGGSGGGIDCEIGAGGTGGSTLELNDDTSCVSPILIDLAGDGFAFGGPENPVIFDLLGLGHPLVLQWVQPGSDDAFLVNDLNGNGFVDDGAELFGNGSRMQLRPGELAINGFQALAQWDQAALGGNEDGVITREDMVWHQLRLWVDADADGISQAHEMWSIERLRTIPVEDAHHDAYGNLLLFWSQAQTGRRSYIMVDVFFRVL